MPSTTPPHVRQADTGDLSMIGAIQAQAWRTVYTGVVPDAVLEQLDPAQLAQHWRAAVTDPPSPRHTVLVAVGNDAVAGFAACDDQGELVALEVDPTHQREGHGSRLLTAIADHGRAHGVDRLIAWCPLTNEARRTFLTSAGFGPSGGVRDLVDASGATVREAQLIALLTEPAPSP